MILGAELKLHLLNYKQAYHNANNFTFALAGSRIGLPICFCSFHFLLHGSCFLHGELGHHEKLWS
jgi:hypothetical protein